jgi:hypothetical protein
VGERVAQQRALAAAGGSGPKRMAQREQAEVRGAEQRAARQGARATEQDGPSGERSQEVARAGEGSAWRAQE